MISEIRDENTRKSNLLGVFIDCSKISIITEASGSGNRSLRENRVNYDKLYTKHTFWANPTFEARFFDTLDNIAIKLFY